MKPIGKKSGRIKDNIMRKIENNYGRNKDNFTKQKKGRRISNEERKLLESL